MILVTGGAGFIGSCLVWKLNDLGFDDILVADVMGTDQRWRNLAKRRISFILHRDDLFQWLDNPKNAEQIDVVYHMGACSTTTETDVDYLMRNNVLYSMKLFQFCAAQKIPFIYASSAATYGLGLNGFVDDPAGMRDLCPINPYGFSKNIFDNWVLKQSEPPPFWVGLKFFNVYGPQEYHKGGQASVAYHAFPQVKEKKRLKLFKSYRDDYKHGEQKRDFVYVKDVVDILYHLYQNRQNVASGIFNVGSGKARTFVDLGNAVFSALNLSPAEFDWIDMPAELKNQYQYFTEADLTNLRNRTGYTRPFASLEDGITDYVRQYLMLADPYL